MGIAEAREIARNAQGKNIDSNTEEGAHNAIDSYVNDVNKYTGANIQYVIVPTPQTATPENPALTQDYTPQQKVEMIDLLTDMGIEQGYAEKFITYASEMNLTMEGGRGILTAFSEYEIELEERAGLDTLWFVYAFEGEFLTEEIEIITALLTELGESSEDIAGFIAFCEVHELYFIHARDLFNMYFYYLSTVELLEKVG